MIFKRKNIKSFLLTTICIVIVWITGCLAPNAQVAGIDPANSNPAVIQKCQDFARIPVREYLLDNNVWGKSNITNYQQCVWADTGSNPLIAGWSWSWQTTDNKKVKAYPEIHYGWDWDKKFTTTKLPLKVNKINKIQVTYDVTTSAEGVYNLAFDLWLTKASFPTRNNLSREVMIWVDGTKKKSGATFIKRATIDGGEYDLYINRDWNYWTYFSFIKVVPQPKGTLNVHEFLFFLKNAEYISSQESLVEIEIGNEVWSGSGKTVVKNYSINVNN
jgi:hypothetical protein